MKKKTARISALLIIAMMLVGIFAACGGNTGTTTTAGGTSTTATASTTAAASGGDTTTAAAATGGGDIITIGQTSDVLSFDPHAQNDMGSGSVLRHIYNRLVAVTPDNQIVPELAESWEVLDDYTIAFKLREDVKWHDGDGFKASDVKYSYERQAVSTHQVQNMSLMKEVEVIDDYNLKIHLKDPAPGVFLLTITHVGCSILGEDQEAAAIAAGKTYNEMPIGTGMYQFVSWKAYDRTVIEPFADYWGAKPANAGLTFKIIPDDPARTIALEAGDIDLLVNVPAVDVQRVRDTASLVLNEYPSTWMEFLVFNLQKSPFDNTKVRQAFSHLIDRESIIAVAESGEAQPLYSPISAGQTAYSPMDNKYPYDVDAAKALLTDAGFGGGFDCEVMLFATNREQTAVIMQQSLQMAGINMGIKNMERAAFYDATALGEHQLDLGGWIAGVEPDSTISPLYHSTSPGDAGNRWFLKDPVVDDYLFKAKIAPEMSERKTIYNDMFHHIMDNAYTVPLYTKNECIAYNAKLVGAVVYSTGSHMYDQLHFE